MVMPSMNGTELADRLSAIRPDIKVLLFPDTPITPLRNTADLAPDTVFLRKPFQPDELTRKVRETLDSHHRLG